MELSVVIVNYNVKYFLEQCLLSVARAVEGISTEVFVVDNASVDGSAEMVRDRFPFVKLICNPENVGFSKANNTAIEKSQGEYILLLNPDTVVAEDTFRKCLTFIEQHPHAGGLGVKMIDGKGNFLPESKRGLPTPSVAFYKTFGLSKLFPRSKIFGRYHLGFLKEDTIDEVDVLPGAFMLLRKSVLDTTGLLDEAFFMYGEDIDLSYRITKAGYKNVYFPESAIIHYKGESTKKGSLNYVRIFYNAMVIFSRKHFSGNQSWLFSLLIKFAIIFRGTLSLLAGPFASSYLFIIDALLSFIGIFLIKSYWEGMIKYSDDYYPTQFLFIVVPVYILIWITATFLNGGYDKPFRISNILRGILFGTVAIAVLYAFIPNEWRFSRAIILLGAAWTAFEMLFTRTAYHLIKYQSLSVGNEDENRSMIVGTNDAARAENILRTLGNSQEIISTPDMAGVGKAAAIHQINEIIFCSSDFSFSDIIGKIAELKDTADYKILNAGSDALIGSNSKDSSGDLYVAERSYALFKAENLRGKRVMDMTLCFVLLLLSPLNIFAIKPFGRFLSNWMSVFTGRKSWVGFACEENLKAFRHSKQGVLNPCDRIRDFELTEANKMEIELNYAKHYSVSSDMKLFFSNYSSLGK